MLIYLSLVISLVGAFMWAAVDAAKYPKLSQAGHDMFQCGLLAFLITAVPTLVALAAGHAR